MATPNKKQRAVLAHMDERGEMIDVYWHTETQCWVRWVDENGHAWDDIKGVGEKTVLATAEAGWIVETGDGYRITDAGRAALRGAKE